MNSWLKELNKSLKQYGVDGLLISSVPHIHYLTNYANFSPLEREAYLLITPKKNYIFTDGRYSETVKKEVPACELVELGQGKPFSAFLSELICQHRLRILGVEENNLTMAEFHLFSGLVRKLKPVPIDSLRVVKERWEIKNIEAACRLGDQAFKHILKLIKPGQSELEVAWEMEKFMRERGSKPSFETIVAFGKNSSVPHHHTGRTRLGKKKGQFILLDFGTRVNGYCSDMTRTIFYGQPSEKQKKIYHTVLKAQELAAKHIHRNIQSGVKGAEADTIARKHILSEGFSTIPHSLGHGIGLEVHELPRLSPRSNDLLTAGMVFSIEPGIYLPGYGGVRIEDLYVIEKKGLRQLTRAPKKLIEF